MKSGEAFRDLLDVLKDADQTFLTGPRAVEGEIAIAEGYRHLAHLLGYAFDLYLEGDAARPEFTPLASPSRKILGDNVDSLYHFAPLDGRRSYRIRGLAGNHVYLAFCVYGGKPDGEWSERVVANVSQRDIVFGPGGEFELSLTPEEWAGAANHVKLDRDAVCVIVRQYFSDRRLARPATIEIEAVSADDAPPPFGDEALARRLRAVATFVRETLNFTPIPPLPEPNVLLPPTPWSPAAPGWGTPDNIYSLGAFALRPDEVLIVEGRSPRCTYWGVQLWNRYMQSLDYRYHRVSINGAEAVLERDGSFRIAIAARDPGIANWLDTVGHAEGLFFCRWLQADEMPTPLTTRVEKLSH
jgi:Protein of unknown function (DUF1214)